MILNVIGIVIGIWLLLGLLSLIWLFWKENQYEDATPFDFVYLLLILVGPFLWWSARVIINYKYRPLKNRKKNE